METYKARQDNAPLFIRRARELLDTHSMRWFEPKLFPAALMLEQPLAQVIAKIMLTTDNPQRRIELTTPTKYHSHVHKCWIDMEDFESFCQEKYASVHYHTEEYNLLRSVALEAAKDVIKGVELCKRHNSRLVSTRSTFGITTCRWHPRHSS